MENQDQRKIHAPENRGIHLCHKCGWPFPNLHPSAKHRRAHKRVCGKVEGYKLIDSERSNHSTLSDDEHGSDDDNKNPSLEIVETSKIEKDFDECKEKLKRLESDVFSDAVAEFSDSKLAGKTKDSSSILEMDKKDDLNSSQSFKDCEISDLVQLPSTLTDKSILHNPEIAESTGADSEAGAENNPSPQIIESEKDENLPVDSQSNVVVEKFEPELKIADFDGESDLVVVAEEVVLLKEENNACIDSETPQIEISSEIAAKSCSSEHLLESNEGGGEEQNEKFEPELKIEDIDGASDRVVVAEEVAQLKEENNACIDSETPQIDISSEIAAKSCSSEYLLESGGGEEEQKGLKLEQSEYPDSNKGMKEEEDESNALKEKSSEEEEMPIRVEVSARERDATEIRLIDDSDEPKEEQEIDHLPKGQVPVVENSRPEGFNKTAMHDCRENRDEMIEEMKGLEEEHLPMVAEYIDELPETDTESVSESSKNVINSNTQLGMIEQENLKPISGLIDSSITPEDGGNITISEPLLVGGSNYNVDKPPENAAPVDVSADSSSQADSVEGTWGSILSVISTRSDVPAIVESRVTDQTSNRTPAEEAEKGDWKMPKAASDVFEPPSFMTLVQSGGGGDGENTSESEPKPEPGWFPSFSHASSESDGRKKNEEIIAKVTSWSSGKQPHIPLKNLLGEAAMEGKPKSPKPENLLPLDKKDEKTATIDDVPGQDYSNNGQLVKSTSEKEWDSPARLPTEIKKGKKKAKGRPYWAQFVCCTSANY